MTSETEHSSRRSPVPGTLREVLVVVVSILIAFSLDAWWDSSKDNREEGSLLRALVSDFAENMDQLDVIIANSETDRDKLLALERMSSSSLTKAQLDSVPDLLRQLVRFSTYNPTTSTLDAAVSTGSLGLIQNADLRNELAGWPSALGESGEQEVWLSTVVLNYNRPFLNRRAMIPHAASGLDNREIDTSLYPDLLTDLEFQNLVTYHIDLLHWAIMDKKRLRDRLARIVDLLEEEIGEANATPD